MTRMLFAVALLAGCTDRAAPGEDRAVKETDPTTSQCSAPAEILPDSIVAPNGKAIAYIGTIDAGREEIEIRSVADGSVLLRFTTDAGDLKWLPDASGLIYSVAPIYGVPGIFVRDLRSDAVITVVSAQIKDAHYPDGADWIRLCDVEGSGSGIVIRFARFGHIDEVDFEHPPQPVIEAMRLPPMN